MEYTTQKELYNALLPAFRVKQRLINQTNNFISNEDIWLCLIDNKWRHSHNLTISEMVNDIITADISLLITYVGGKNEENKIYN